VLDALLGARVFLKAETLQRTGSFSSAAPTTGFPRSRRTARPTAWWPIRPAITPRAWPHGGGALQHAGGDRDAVDAPQAKRERTAALAPKWCCTTATPRIAPRSPAHRATAGAVLVPPFDDPYVIAGQGTAGREICEDLEKLGVTPDVVVVGTSGGGLIAGIALAIKARVPARSSIRPSPRASTTRCARSRAASARPIRG